MLSVALVTSSFLPRVGGVEEHVRQVARDLHRRGHRVTVWAVDQGDDGPAEVDGVRVRYLPCPLPARDAASLARFTRDVTRAALVWRDAVRADRPDVLHVHCFGPNGPWAAATARWAGIPLVLTSHGETFADANGVFDRSRLLATALRRTVSRAIAVTGPSRFTLEDLERRFGLAAGSGIVVPNGVDLHEAGDGAATEAPAGLPGRYLLAVGRMVRVKGFDLLLEAFSRLAVGDPGLGLVLAGDGPEAAALARRADDLGLADRVVLPGRLAPAGVAAAMHGAAAVVVPSRFESFGIVVLEAWRAGVPVVATTRGGPPEFVTDGVDGVLVDPEDVPALTRALARVLGDQDAAFRLGGAGARSVRDYSWGRVVDAYLELYGHAAPAATHGLVPRAADRA
ncbi:glycosyltransferase family 4 protein [Isoptericola rhizosphaerae]|uniref:glycosyltransferase family 4 protein n=1 Tax=Isoptericola rhizosphaerae TaxID=3377837 RepID=UPI00383BAE66